MSGSERPAIKDPSDGIKGLAMMAPVVGLPLAFHAVGGVVLSGAGFMAIATMLSPFRDEIMKVMSGVAGTSKNLNKSVPESEAIAVTDDDSVRLTN
jgi:hypothetical protein